jgi:hypothetical protein
MANDKVKTEQFVNPTLQSLAEINKPFIGGGMSQTYSAIYFLEHYIRIHEFDYIVEFGTQKGTLSLYLANLACVTEQFTFETFDISTHDYYNREGNGVGHWLDKIARYSSGRVIINQNADIFDNYRVQHFEQAITKSTKTLILADNGNKPLEVEIYGKMLRSQDRIMAHDWEAEIHQRDIDFNMLEYDQPYHQYAQQLQTKWCVLKKKN